MSVRAGVSIAGLPFSSPDAFYRWVDVCEDSNVDSIWLTERLVSPTPFLEPLTAFGVIAGRTKRLKFGMNATVIPLRDPLVLAKQCATLDYLSGGRLLPAFGVGRDTAPEFAATGREPRGRGERANEILQLIARLWSKDSVDFDGRYYKYSGASISPKPVQQPLPIWIGGSSDAAIRRTALYGTGWLGGIMAPAQVAPVVQKIKAAVAEAGRVIDDDHYGAGFPFRFGSPDDEVVQRAAERLRRLGEAPVESYLALGGADDILSRAAEYARAGVSKFVLSPIAAGDDDFLEQTRRLDAEVLPILHDPDWTAD
ncbi:MAG TPA: TIGR03619 family F420-dependent LLM class oxidoreductase [Dehalococcoidia bacterium]|nr:TIGR03619 family F420-dependent LLM class oxidoreductase [Dehalococcoidia bacterium]